MEWCGGASASERRWWRAASSRGVGTPENGLLLSASGRRGPLKQAPPDPEKSENAPATLLGYICEMRKRWGRASKIRAPLGRAIRAFQCH